MDLEMGGHGHVIFGARWTYWAWENPKTQSTQPNDPKL